MEIDFEKSNGLVPVIVQENKTNIVLMLAYMNKQAFDLTVKTKIAHYYSRSRKEIWKKGETSGNTQSVIDLKVDCDKDTILLIVNQKNRKACHTESKTCFLESYFKGKNKNKEQIEESNIANLPSKYGNFKVKVYKDGSQEHLAIMSENFFELDEPNVRIHSECLTGDSVGSLKCDCNNQLTLALNLISKEGGLVIYHRQEGRNIGLLNKINAYNLQDKGLNTVDANLKLGFEVDEREYSAIGYILKDLKVKKMRFITNNPRKIDYLKSLNIEIISRVSAITPVNKYNENYLKVKKESLNHLL